ncbi:MAG: heavy metal translocating P-type ATPase, partial [Candidatus Odinarchaeia archaeon]
LLNYFSGYTLPVLILFIVVMGVSGFEIIKHGFVSLYRKRFDINFLVTIAAVGAFIIMHGEEGAAVMFLFSLAEFLEDYAGDRVRKSIKDLLSLTPDVATVKRKEGSFVLHIHQIDAGELITVKPGEVIPLDGVIVKGFSSVNQAPITGESIPVFKTVNDQVFAGSINLNGYLEIKVTKRSEEGLLSKVKKLVEEASIKKSDTEAFVDKFSGYYTPIIILSALFVMFFPYFALNQPLIEWIYRGLILLVISCPCALAISTPVSMVSSIINASKNGIIIKGGKFIEKLRKSKVIVFDKTGTLTKGQLKVVDAVPLEPFKKVDLLNLAASLESKSNHPVSQAILEYTKQVKADPFVLSKFESFPGKGLTGLIDGKRYFSGSVKFFKSMGYKLPSHLIDKLEEAGKTVILYGDSNSIIGIITLTDEIKDDAFSLIKYLKNNGFSIFMLTGDNKKVAKAVASNIGVNDFFANLLPLDKVKIINKLSEEFEEVIMVGDGVNDAPALARASVSIAMGAMGSDIAVEAADIVLMDDKLSKISYLIELSKKTMSVIKQNISASIFIKNIIGILALFGLITLWMAVGFGDMGLSLAVILNAFRIGFNK